MEPSRCSMPLCLCACGNTRHPLLIFCRPPLQEQLRVFLGGRFAGSPAMGCGTVCSPGPLAFPSSPGTHLAPEERGGSSRCPGAGSSPLSRCLAPVAAGRSRARPETKDLTAHSTADTTSSQSCICTGIPVALNVPQGGEEQPRWLLVHAVSLCPR